jgi:hypothetical protein
LAQEIAEENEFTWYELIIGKSHPKPYMKNEDKDILHSLKAVFQLHLILAVVALSQ